MTSRAKSFNLIDVQKKKSINTVIKRQVTRELGIFVDGPALDRACRRLEKRISWQGLLESLSGGMKPEIARYYTIVPYDDDSRQRSFLDAVERAGFEVIVKRLPPKGNERYTAIDVEMTTDMVEYALKQYSLGQSDQSQESSEIKLVRTITVVCPSPDLSYPFSLLSKYPITTNSADFGAFAGRNSMKSAKNWIDLTDSPLIWVDQSV